MSNDTSQSNTLITQPTNSVDDAAEIILNNWKTDDLPPEDDNQETTTEPGEIAAEVEEAKEEVVEESQSNEDPENGNQDEDQDESEDETDEEQEEEESEEEQEVLEEEINLSDDTLIEIKVDGEIKQASVKDLKRLYGQEASLTKKSQETASQKKQAEDQISKTDATLQAMLKRAEDRWKPYSELDYFVASRQMNPEDFKLLRAEATAAESDLKFLKEEAQDFYGQLQEQSQKERQEQAGKAIEVLKADIPNWSTSLYNDIREYTINSGLPEEQVNNLADPTVIKLLHKAMLFDKSKKVATIKRTKAPKKVLRSKKAPPNRTDLKIAKRKAAVDKLVNSPSRGNDLDDVAEALLSRWEA
jgi:hypothetical protein